MEGDPVMKKRRILFLNLGGFMGGIESYLENLTAMLEGHAELYSLCVLPELASRLRKNGVEVVVLPTFSGFLKPLRFVAAFFILPFLILRWKIDVVQLNGFLEAILLLQARLLGREAIYTKHGPFEDDLYAWYKNPGRFLSREASRISAQFANSIVCVSEAVGEDVRTKVAPEKVVVIPNWVSYVPLQKIRGEFLRQPARLLYVGRLERYKGLHLLLEAMQEIPDVELTVVGDGAYRAQLEEFAQGMNVHFEGFQKNPQPYYDAADIFIMPSMGPEGLPMVAIEAMSQCLPCLFSSLSVHQEITDYGRAGMLFGLGDSKDLKKRLELLLSDSNLRMRYSSEAHNIVKRRYNPETAREAYFSVFNLGSRNNFLSHEMREEWIS
jgi:glycosyltransferase involved in cell wall biosynthesis